MPYKVLLLDNVDPVCASVFNERGVETEEPGKLDTEELKKIIGNYDGMVVRSATTVNADLLKHAGKLSVIGRAGVGVDNIDIQAATARGILVMNTPDGNTISTAEHTCGMILAMARNIPTAVERVKSGGWDRKKFMGTELHRKILGIVGLGKIGSEVAVRMKAFGMDIIAYDPFTTHEHAAEFGIELKELDEVLKKSDFLTVHTPLTEKTQGIISLKNAEKLKKGVRLVNCARGGIIEEADMYQLLETGIVAGIAVDVYSTEPPDEELYKILRHPGIICTPHLGASTEEAQEKVAIQIAEQISDALESKSFKGSLNGKSIALLTNKEVNPYLKLSEKLGRLAGQIKPEHSNQFSFEYTGLCARYSEVLTDSILKGMLAQFVDESVNLINARHFAEERNFKISETTSTNDKMYKDLITIRLGDDAEYHNISATVFGPDDYRIVEIDGYGIEIQLEGNILMYRNIDKPGMLASVAGKLASNGVNIGALSLGRDKKGSNAITAIIVDKHLSSDELKPFFEMEDVHDVKYISLS
ncbi:MAG: phosphoglycerate dehydrogenase [Balneolaceae bacterium]